MPAALSVDGCPQRKGLVMIKIWCRHCGNTVIPRQIQVKGRVKIHTEAWCPDCEVAIKGLNAAEERAAAAPELDGVALPPRQAYKAGEALKQMKRLWRKLRREDRFRLYEWMDKRERAEAHGQA